jgi:hypothetical protein
LYICSVRSCHPLAANSFQKPQPLTFCSAITWYPNCISLQPIQVTLYFCSAQQYQQATAIVFINLIFYSHFNCVQHFLPNLFLHGRMLPPSYFQSFCSNPNNLYFCPAMSRRPPAIRSVQQSRQLLADGLQLPIPGGNRDSPCL